MESANMRTPLYDEHVRLGGKIVDFHGWLLPIQYSSILLEHETVRRKAGLFDVSHMGEIEVNGSGALHFLQRLLINDIGAKPGKMPMQGKAVYSPMCYPDGGTVDDLIVYKQAADRYLLVVNASNTVKDYQWMMDNKDDGVNILDRSNEYAQLALQGPDAANILGQLLEHQPEPQLEPQPDPQFGQNDLLTSLKSFHFIDNVSVGGVNVMLSRTGYTGEDGFELYCRPDDAAKLWNMLLEKGAAFGLLPVGLGARDTLRLEASLPLYGQELSESISPIMAGLQRFFKPEKGDFIGKVPLLAQLNGSQNSVIAGFEMTDRAVPRTGYEVYCDGKIAGHVTSGGYFPTLKKNMGLALVDSSCAAAENIIEVMVRNKPYAARIVKLPFYKR